MQKYQAVLVNFPHTHVFLKQKTLPTNNECQFEWTTIRSFCRIIYQIKTNNLTIGWLLIKMHVINDASYA